jgi:hypothetical protein
MTPLVIKGGWGTAFQPSTRSSRPIPSESVSGLDTDETIDVLSAVTLPAASLRPPRKNPVTRTTTAPAAATRYIVGIRPTTPRHPATRSSSGISSSASSGGARSAVGSHSSGGVSMSSVFTMSYSRCEILPSPASGPDLAGLRVGCSRCSLGGDLFPSAAIGEIGR